MQLLHRGKSVFDGIAIGKICVYEKDKYKVDCVKIEDADGEMKRYQKAKSEAVGQLCALHDKALREVGEVHAAIFEMHQMMLEDMTYNQSVENRIRSQMVNAEYAVASTCDEFVKMFEAMDDDYMSARAADIQDISERLLNVLKGGGSQRIDIKEPVIIVADDLSPSETVLLDKDRVLAFVTVRGSVNSHTAILARTMGIPALVGAEISLENALDGRMGIVDGSNGIIYIDPDEVVLEEMRERQKAEIEKKQLAHLLKGRENRTLDGQRVMLAANVGSVRELENVIENDADGIGLFRSEFIYLEKDHFPTEEEQFQIYKTVAEKMAGKPVIIRTLDIGADKQCAYFGMEKEENPAMGYRAIRICLTRPEIFKTQLRALLRASMYGNISVMYPMIISVDEVHRIQALVKEVKEELTEQGTAFGHPAQGIMIETPAAVMMSRELAEEVDFFSIGTNDLTQYTLAIDRQNEKLDNFYDGHHPAVLRMIKMVVDNAHAAGIWAGICGELAADQELTKEFLAMGVDELSVAPANVLPIKKIIIETDVAAEKKKWN